MRRRAVAGRREGGGVSGHRIRNEREGGEASGGRIRNDTK
jgi:hypothetical protein